MFVWSSSDIVENSYVMSKESKEMCRDFFRHYYPKCMSTTLPDEEKFVSMTEWWSKEHDMITKTGMRKEDISKIVEQSDVVLREGCDMLFKNLADNSVPLVVCTAGIEDISSAVIKDRATLYDNISFMGNKMDFDANGKIVGLSCKGTVINQYNKREMTNIYRDYFEQHMDRPNVLLIGDSIGDLQLAEGLIQPEYVLKIGFLNSHVDQNLEVYKSKFDIVVVEDSTMDVPNAVVNKIMLSSQEN
ncbi:cytosolic 5'-nucleotidase 3A-like isoform X2 [Anneissia japonica]|uniref:cytosolic 5'-nucleotidase 3A-like isoform X2 n=1 Tax=Anneissia japonica TaxID=1529436 RepID=UPI00142555A0|nr:cytosolic 5'-nucleotidase 3A-like isoform X2 [Anneissia japonica]